MLSCKLLSSGAAFVLYMMCGKIPQTLHDLMESSEAPMAMPELCGIDNSECQRQAAVFLIKISSKLQIHYQITRKIP
jgi:hypothetical protein